MGKPTDLAKEICELLARRDASDMDGATALTMVLMLGFIDQNFSKQRALGIIGNIWDDLEDQTSAREGHC